MGSSKNFCGQLNLHIAHTPGRRSRMPSISLKYSFLVLPTGIYMFDAMAYSHLPVHLTVSLSLYVGGRDLPDECGCCVCIFQWHLAGFT